jgi:D-galactarolactone cycloisomerase
MIKIQQVETFVYRYPLETPVQTSFGTMTDRPMVIVKLTDQDNVVGFGEIWCNYPACGAEHRANLVQSIFAKLIYSHTFTKPSESFELLTSKTWVLCLQTGEYGPIAQCIAGIDIAMHDLFARRHLTPLWKYLGGTRSEVTTYASGISPVNAIETAKLALSMGHDSLKLKIGFDQNNDLKNIRELSYLLGGCGKLLLDANQSWNVEQAKYMAEKIESFDVFWLEEPIAADRPEDEWHELNQICQIPLAAGENIFSEGKFFHIISENYIDIVQPDLAKWGGLTKTTQVAKAVIAKRKLYCPHFLGGGVGLLASAHALAAAGGNGILEVDCNPNPLRTFLVEDFFNKSMSSMTLNDEPGIGVEPDLLAIAEYRIK